MIKKEGSSDFLQREQREQNIIKSLSEGINNQSWPGETVALLEETNGLNNFTVNKFSFDPNIAYVQL